MLIRKWVEPKVAPMFYREVTEAVLLFVLDSWVLSVAMDRTVEVIHAGCSETNHRKAGTAEGGQDVFY